MLAWLCKERGVFIAQLCGATTKKIVIRRCLALRALADFQNGRARHITVPPVATEFLSGIFSQTSAGTIQLTGRTACWPWLRRPRRKRVLAAPRRDLGTCTVWSAFDAWRRGVACT